MEYLYIKNQYTIKQSYRDCRDIFWKSYKSYYLGALLFDKDNFFHICSLYTFIRIVNSIVNNSEDSIETKKENLKLFKEKFFLIYDKYFMDNLDKNKFWIYCGIPKELWAFFFTIYSIGIERNLIEKIFNSMEMDLYKFEYENLSELEEYMEGYAYVIGEIMYLIIKNGKEKEYYQKIEIKHNMNDYARRLGMAFQLTNFIRDISEDFEMIPYKIYIPKTHQRKYSINLHKYLEGKQINKYHSFITLLQFELNLSEKIYKEAQKGIELLDPKQKDNIEIVKSMYYEINNKIKINKFMFLKCGKIKVSTFKKIKICYQKLGFLGLMNLGYRYIYYTYLI